jgi:hypothetical protein
LIEHSSPDRVLNCPVVAARSDDTPQVLHVALEDRFLLGQQESALAE